VLLRSSRTAH